MDSMIIAQYKLVQTGANPRTFWKGIYVPSHGKIDCLLVLLMGVCSVVFVGSWLVMGERQRAMQMKRAKNSRFCCICLRIIAKRGRSGH